MKNILIFLHGKGANQTAHCDFIKKLAAKYQAEVYTFNAPYPHKNGYKWFDKDLVNGVRIVNQKNFETSLNFIFQKINRLTNDYSKVIICGHSQGGAMAIAAGLRIGPQKVISICGDWPFEIPEKVQTPATEFVWVEAGKDTFLSNERKQSYLKLTEAGIVLKYLCDPNSSHDSFSPNLLEKL